MIGGNERLSTIGQDLRYAFRTLLSAPGFALATVLVLALGIGANTAIFGVVNAVLLQPLPYRQPERLVRIYETFPLAGGKSGDGAVSYPNFRDWKEQTHSFSGLALAGWPSSVNLQGRGEPERLQAMPVGADLFSLLGARPLLGRTFAAGEDQPGAPPVVVLGEGFWRSHLGADPKVIGRTLPLDGQQATVIGVMPDAFRFPAGRKPVDLWIPLQVRWQEFRGSHAYQVYGRLKPGASLETARAEMERIAANLARAYPDQQEGRSAKVVPVRDDVVGRVKPVLLVLLGAAGLLLLIACANAASLLLARGVARQREVAIRVALGAGRARVVRQFLTESLVLSGAGAAVGLGLAWWAARGISATAGRLLPRATEVGIDARVAGFLVAVAILTGIVFGLVPALQVSRTDLSDHLRQGGRGGGIGRGGRVLRSGLVVAQIAFSLVLLVGAGLLMRTFVALMSTETGMHAENVLTLHVSLPEGKYGDDHDPVTNFYQPVLERVRALPGVRDAGAITMLPLQDYGMNGNFGIAGKTYPSVAEQPFAEYRVVTSGYFASLGIPIVRGRDIAPQDAADAAPVAVVNQAVADRYFKGEDPIGQRLTGFDSVGITIVGVAGDVRQAQLDQPARPEIYFPIGQAGTSIVTSMALVVRTGVDPGAMTRSVVAAIHQVDPEQPVYNVESMKQVVRDAVSDRRLYLWLLGSFAVIAGALAVAGIYGLVSYSVTQRTREFGIRLALGSEAGRMTRMVVWQGGRLAVFGLLIGLPAAYLLTRLLASLLYGVGAADPLTYAAVGIGLAGVALAASWLPARRATRVDPVIALRTE